MLNLSGQITVVRRLADSWLFEREPLCALACWLDLLLLARTEAGYINVNGHQVALQRGDVGFAIHNLALRWRRSRVFTTKLISDLAERRQVQLIPVEPGSPRRGTIIRIVNYETYNVDIKSDNNSDNNVDIKSDNNSDNNVDIKLDIKEEEGRGRKEERKGEAPPPKELRNHPDVPTAIEHFQKMGADYNAEEIRAAWLKLTVDAIDGQWVSGRHQRPIADWRLALELEVQNRRLVFGDKKNPAPSLPQKKSAPLNLAEMQGATA